VDTLIVMADHARAIGDESSMRRHLARGRRRTSSVLQEAQVELVDTVASGDHLRLVALRDDATRRGFGLISATAEAVIRYLDDPKAPATVFYRPHLPLAGTY
jgi:hypothetical protein